MFPIESGSGVRHSTFHAVGVVTNGDVYRRLQEPEGDERSVVSSTSIENDADEYHLLIDESVKKSPRAVAAPVGRKVPLTGGNSCTRNRIFVCAIGMFSFFTLLMMNLPLGSEKGRSGETFSSHVWHIPSVLYWLWGNLSLCYSSLSNVNIAYLR